MEEFVDETKSRFVLLGVGAAEKRWRGAAAEFVG